MLQRTDIVHKIQIWILEIASTQDRLGRLANYLTKKKKMKNITDQKPKLKIIV